MILEKEVNVDVEVNGKKFINSGDGILYRDIDYKEIILYIKSSSENNELKIKITRKE